MLARCKRCLLHKTKGISQIINDFQRGVDKHENPGNYINLTIWELYM